MINLTSIGLTVYYTYNSDGIRTSKTVNGTKHTYAISGSTVLNESWTDTDGVEHLLIYFYDAAGNPIGMQYRNSTYSIGTVDSYLFVTNLQGDIEYIYDAYGNRVVYDAWGNILSVTGSGATTVGSMNPFRYRGYYYDTETGFYYLNSRYYNPEIGRFINADAYIATGQGFLGNNMFAYCGNNPVNRVDPAGKCHHNNSPFDVDCPKCLSGDDGDDIDEEDLSLPPAKLLDPFSDPLDAASIIFFFVDFSMSVNLAYIHYSICNSTRPSYMGLGTFRKRIQDTVRNLIN